MASPKKRAEHKELAPPRQIRGVSVIVDLKALIIMIFLSMNKAALFSLC